MGYSGGSGVRPPGDLPSPVPKPPVLIWPAALRGASGTCPGALRGALVPRPGCAMHSMTRWGLRTSSSQSGSSSSIWTT